MNNIQELIEDLKSIMLYFSRNHEGLLYVAYAATIQQAITALESMQAPLPEEIAIHVASLEDAEGRLWDDGYLLHVDSVRKAKKYIERLAYEDQCHILARKEDKQRIEKLARESAYKDRAIDEYGKTVNKLQQRIEELENEIKLLLHVTKGDKEEVKRLEAALRDIYRITGNIQIKAIIEKARAGND